ncbi:hypothetical protein [Amycolatopsis sp. SID8362]|uniref:hypothetical protein n=1 Tax=Amycolatopsis sp. SID8362 TaxID=2690346 RepID=UPI00137160BF|nr:hypothetical protein [Amycolatopsis sp. SID8362]NBH06668.1 hypothetical protein [Amycolatopsis sp. SID8362]NED43365.1 hypothetical protein [Amycolatopsis sp. SID8362]
MYSGDSANVDDSMLWLVRAMAQWLAGDTDESSDEARRVAVAETRWQELAASPVELLKQGDVPEESTATGMWYGGLFPYLYAMSDAGRLEAVGQSMESVTVCAALAQWYESDWYVASVAGQAGGGESVEGQAPGTSPPITYDEARELYDEVVPKLMAMDPELAEAIKTDEYVRAKILQRIMEMAREVD